MQTQAKPVSPRAAKMAENKANKRVEAAYYARCRGITINVMDIGKVFAAGKAALAKNPQLTDQELGDVVAAFVETIRQN